MDTIAHRFDRASLPQIRRRANLLSRIKQTFFRLIDRIVPRHPVREPPPREWFIYPPF